MASIGHIAIGMAAARHHRRSGPARWTLFSAMVVWSAISLLPDADVVGFHFGVAYGDPWGHRGATHSLVFSALGGCVLGLLAKSAGLSGWRTGALAALVLASHGLLDALTDGGLGCALLWPFSNERFFAPWTPIPVSPIGRAYLSSAGLTVALWEITAFAPFLLYALWPRARRKQR